MRVAEMVAAGEVPNEEVRHENFHAEDSDDGRIVQCCGGGGRGEA
jgi:hypothetical protein